MLYCILNARGIIAATNIISYSFDFFFFFYRIHVTDIILYTISLCVGSINLFIYNITRRVLQSYADESNNHRRRCSGFLSLYYVCQLYITIILYIYKYCHTYAALRSFHFPYCRAKWKIRAYGVRKKP